MADDFFQEQIADVPIEKVKVGEDEYTQDELQRLVGLGKIGDEAEKSMKIRLDKVWPRTQQVINEKRELEARYAELEKKVTQTPYTPPAAGAEMTQEQIKAAALKQAKELGLVSREELTQEARRIASEMMQGQKLLEDIDNVIDTMTGEGLPRTSTEELIQHMQETGIKNPQKAYKDMFEKEWVESQAKKLASIKPNGMPSLNASAAGGKLPPSVRVTKDNLEALVSESIKDSFQ
jgi:BMFP domain-containing protein YqiC